MNRLVAIAVLSLGVFADASALCKYRAADGAWTYAKTCREKPAKEIDGNAGLVLQRNRELRTDDEGLEGRRLRGYEYSTTTNSGMRIPMVEPAKARPENEFTKP